MRAFNWGSQEGEDKHGTRLGTPDTGYTLAEAEICNVLEHKENLNKSFQSFRFLDTYSLKAKAILDLLKWSVINIAPLTLNSVCNAFDGLMGR